MPEPKFAWLSLRHLPEISSRSWSVISQSTFAKYRSELNGRTVGPNCELTPGGSTDEIGAPVPVVEIPGSMDAGVLKRLPS